MSADPTSAPSVNQIDFDHHAPEFRDHNKAVVRRLHATGCPLGHSSHHGGYWAIYGYEGLYDAVQDPDLFSSRHELPDHAKGIPPTTSPLPLIPIDIDGPMVHEYRRITLGYLSPGGAKREEPRIREITTELIDAFIERGECDLTQELLTAVPARWILEALGWDTARWSEWIVWIHTMIHERADQPEKADEAIGNLIANILTEIGRRRSSDDLGDDLTGEILRATPAGAPLTDGELIGYFLLLLLGGMDTTAGLTGNAIVELDQDHHLRQRLIDDRSLLPAATEEFLRHDSPSYGLYRTVTRDVVFYGQQLRAGDRVVMMFPAAGLDPHEFDEPEQIRLDRVGNRHMAFGLGPHRCLGSHHARMMFQVMLHEILDRLPDFRVSGPIERFHDGGDVYAVRHLPISFTPGPQRGGSAGTTLCDR